MLSGWAQRKRFACVKFEFRFFETDFLSGSSVGAVDRNRHHYYQRLAWNTKYLHFRNKIQSNEMKNLEQIKRVHFVPPQDNFDLQKNHQEIAAFKLIEVCAFISDTSLMWQNRTVCGSANISLFNGKWERKKTENLKFQQVSSINW